MTCCKKNLATLNGRIHLRPLSRISSTLFPWAATSQTFDSKQQLVDCEAIGESHGRDQSPSPTLGPACDLQECLKQIQQERFGHAVLGIWLGGFSDAGSQVRGSSQPFLPSLWMASFALAGGPAASTGCCSEGFFYWISISLPSFQTPKLQANCGLQDGASSQHPKSDWVWSLCRP
jgi:hypothetical protein